MTIRAKTAVIVGSTLGLMLISLYWGSRGIILNRFAALGVQYTRLNVQRVLEAIGEDVTTLNEKAGAWAVWDDAYRFMDDHNSAFVASNLSTDTIATLQISVVAFVDPSGHIVKAVAMNPATGRTEAVPASLRQHLHPQGILATGPGGHPRKGILMLPEGPMMVSARPILTSNKTGPARGTLLFGRYLDASRVNRLSHMTHLPISIRRFDRVAGADSGGLGRGEIAIQTHGSRTITGRAVLEDVYGRPALVASITSPRTIFRQGLASMRLLLLSLLAAGVVSTALTLLVLDHAVIRRLTRLIGDLNGIGASGDLTRRLQVSGRDELATLSSSINHTLDTVQKARDDLESRVRERTAELARANESLTAEVEERARIEEETRKAHEENERLLAAMSSAVIGLDENRVIRQWNQAAEQVFGISSAEAVGRPLDGCGIRWDAPETLSTLLGIVEQNAPASLDSAAVVGGEGSPRLLSVAVTPLHDDADHPSGWLVLCADVTEQRNLETQLAHSQKLESIGQLAAGIAHEINTPIQYVGDNTRFLQESFGDILKLVEKQREALEQGTDGPIPPEVLDDVRAAARAADIEYLSTEVPAAVSQSLEGVARVAKIVQAMKMFSHPGSDEKTPADINRAIESTITVCRNEWKYVADLTTDLDPDLPLVPCLMADLNQVVLNLIVNAAHAIKSRIGPDSSEKGTITVSTSHTADWAEIRVSDTGTGIPEEIRHRIFDPFFTTKDVGKGTGQGLAIARSVITKKHDGTISFETEEGVGTTFMIRLPILREAA